MHADVTTGLSGLDEVLQGVMPGDNIVWQFDDVENYKALVLPYAKAACQAGRRLIYFRFATHEKLIPDDFRAEIHALDPGLGFESFVTQVHRVIDDAGRHAIYVFDCLSELASLWLADQMLGNFFLLTCPRLCDLEAVAYFGILRNYHASFALNPITETTQFLLDVFRHEGRIHVRPIKVQRRSRSLMNTVHVWEGEAFRPITSSAPLSEALASSQWPGLRADTRLGFWRRIFDEAQHTFDEARAGRCSSAEEKDVFDRLSRMVLSRDEAMLRLVHQYLSLADILEIRDRMIGIGLIGGKALGMLLARAILKRDSVFCVNQGTRKERFETLLDTVRQVYASTVSEQALRYRMSRGLLDRDEQMGLLVMRVSGGRYGDTFLPHVAGVGFSFNPYVWHGEIAPQAGVLRLVFGLGTRAVDRADDDHTRLVALNAPSRRPESTFDEVCEYSQRRVDYLDLAANRFESSHFLDLVTEAPGLPLDMVASRDRAALPGQGEAHYVLTFDGLLANTPFV